MASGARDEVSALLARIAGSLEGKSEIEIDNLRLDLSAVVRRLESGAYEESDYAERNVFDVARRTREFLHYFAGWNAQAARWAAILGPHLGGVREVLDLCPGWAPKIELALTRLRFSGRVRMIDKDGGAMRELLAFFAILESPLRVEAIEADIFAEPVAAVAELVVANHLVDDVLLDLWSPRLGIDAALAYEREAALRDAWRRILGARSEIEAAFPPLLAGALARHVAPGGVLIVSHYQSNVDRLMGTDESRAVFEELFQRLRRELADLGMDEVALPGEQGRVVAFRKR
jgi:hypothetical protein